MGMLMAYLSSATGKRFEPGDVKLWRGMLNDIPFPVLERAVHRYCRERKEFPTVSDIRDMAAEAQTGELDEAAGAFERLTKAIRRHGSYDREGAQRALDPLTWAAMEAAGGWGWACDLTAENRQTYSAQFRMAYQSLAGREERHRRLPAHLRPGITNGTPMVSLPQPKPEKPSRPALPAPEQPAEAAVDKAKLLRVFRDPVAAPPVSEEEFQRRKAEQAERARKLIAEREAVT